MPVIRTLPKADKEELRDHRDNTSKLMIKTYTLRQLSYMDWIDTRTVKNSPRYIPIRVDTWESATRFRVWRTKKPYMIRYVRLDEIKFIFNKRTKKNLIVD